MRAEEHGVQVRRQHAAPLRKRELLEGRVRVDARVVDEHVDAPVHRDDAVDGAANRLLDGDVDRLRGGVRALRAKLVRGPRSALGVPVEDDDAGSLPRKPAGDREPDPARCAGDDRDLAVECSHGCTLHAARVPGVHSGACGLRR